MELVLEKAVQLQVINQNSGNSLSSIEELFSYWMKFHYLTNFLLYIPEKWYFSSAENYDAKNKSCEKVLDTEKLK